MIRKAWAYVVTGITAAVMAWIYWSGKRAGRNEVEVEAARNAAERRKQAEDSARTAERSGAAQRLRDGNF
jgi:hypothetical protein